MTVKLIMVEGLPGSGKSTISALIRDILGQMGINSRLYLEGDLDHPADFESVALLDKDEFIQLSSSFSNFEQMMKRVSWQQDENYFISYGKLIKRLDGALPEELLKKLAALDIYQLPYDRHVDLISNRWADFAGIARQANTVNIFECCFIQNPLTVTMIRDNSPREVGLEYINRLADTIGYLDPLLIYLYQEDVEYSFRRAIKERPEAWLDFFVDYYTKQGYGRAYNLKGVDGAIKLLQERQQVELEIVKSLEIETVMLDNSHYDIEKVGNELREILAGIDISGRRR